MDRTATDYIDEMTNITYTDYSLVEQDLTLLVVWQEGHITHEYPVPAINSPHYCWGHGISWSNSREEGQFNKTENNVTVNIYSTFGCWLSALYTDFTLNTHSLIT